MMKNDLKLNLKTSSDKNKFKKYFLMKFVKN